MRFAIGFLGCWIFLAGIGRVSVAQTTRPLSEAYETVGKTPLLDTDAVNPVEFSARVRILVGNDAGMGALVHCKPNSPCELIVYDLSDGMPLLVAMGGSTFAYDLHTGTIAYISDSEPFLTLGATSESLTWYYGCLPGNAKFLARTRIDLQSIFSTKLATSQVTFFGEGDGLRRLVERTPTGSCAAARFSSRSPFPTKLVMLGKDNSAKVIVDEIAVGPQEFAWSKPLNLREISKLVAVTDEMTETDRRRLVEGVFQGIFFRISLRNPEMLKRSLEGIKDLNLETVAANEDTLSKNWPVALAQQHFPKIERGDFAAINCEIDEMLKAPTASRP